VRSGASTPEELEALLEDALVLRDHESLVELFDEAAVLDAGVGPREARGAAEIRRLATVLCLGRPFYLAEPRRVVQARDTALVVSERGVSVAQRSGDGSWRYTISVLSLNGPREER
jgi:hypothetical protein